MSHWSYQKAVTFGGLPCPGRGHWILTTKALQKEKRLCVSRWVSSILEKESWLLSCPEDGGKCLSFFELNQQRWVWDGFVKAKVGREMQDADGSGL